MRESVKTRGFHDLQAKPSLRTPQAVLRRYYEEFNETAAEGVDYAMLDAIAFFRDTLAPLESAIVAVFIIG